jgi:hypothetical protein
VDLFGIRKNRNRETCGGFPGMDGARLLVKPDAADRESCFM